MRSTESALVSVTEPPAGDAADGSCGAAESGAPVGRKHDQIRVMENKGVNRGKKGSR